GLGAVELAGQRVVQDFVDERTLAGAADASDGDEATERDADVDVLEVVVAGADDRQIPLTPPAPLSHKGRGGGQRSSSPPPPPGGGGGGGVGGHPPIGRYRDRFLAR